MFLKEPLQTERLHSLKSLSFSQKRRPTRVVWVGNVPVGGHEPLRLQSMTTPSTMDTSATVDQVLRLVDVGCEIVRITAPTIREARNLEAIKSSLLQKNCNVPLVADIHFRPDAAMESANFVEKVRINPGNFTDGKAFKVREYSDLDYQLELDRIEERFTPLVLKLKSLKRALRIGTNHGSLSDRIMNRYGDTPLGMVESALEFVRICQRNDFHDIILSMKSSNPRVMIVSYRLLALRMAEEGMNYPFHLGVTEAGDGDDGRIKSAVGIGCLLEDGMGDTIRVSLTEDPELEIPVASDLAHSYPDHPRNDSSQEKPMPIDLELKDRRPTRSVQTGGLSLGDKSPIRVLHHLEASSLSVTSVLALLEDQLKKDHPPEILHIPYETRLEKSFQPFQRDLKKESNWLSLWISYQKGNVPQTIRLQPDAVGYRVEKDWRQDELTRLSNFCQTHSLPLFLVASSSSQLIEMKEFIKDTHLSLIFAVAGLEDNLIQEVRSLIKILTSRKDRSGILLWNPRNQYSLRTAVLFGSLLCDGIGDVISTSSQHLNSKAIEFSYNLLQACGTRITKTEFVSCPSCGRTLFDLQSTTERIKSKTGHLKGVKIAIMGCIVNGPGEMADADFGYVGGGPGKINLFVGKQCVEKSIPTELADNRLIELIKTHGKWVDPPSLA